MKNLTIKVTLSLLSALLFISCKDKPENPDPDKGSLQLMIDNKAMDLEGNSVDLQLDTFGYKTAEGDTISFNHIKYFVSNIKLVNTDNDTVELPETYWLKNQNADYTSASSSHTISDVEVGTYNTVLFSIGVSSNCNTVEACTTGDLDPYSTDAEKMIWDWSNNSGYKFWRMEGSFKGNNTSTSGAIDGGFSFHVGSNSNFVTLSFTPGDAILIEKDKTTMVHFMAMIQNVFTNPNSIDLEAANSQGTIGASNIASNYSNGVFMLHHINAPM